MASRASVKTGLVERSLLGGGAGIGVGSLVVPTVGRVPKLVVPDYLQYR